MCLLVHVTVALPFLGTIMVDSSVAVNFLCSGQQCASPPTSMQASPSKCAEH